MDRNTPLQDIATTKAKPAYVALNVLALCFSLALVGRGLGESFTVFLKPIAENFGWDRAQIISAYSLTWLSGGLMSPFIGRLFDHSGPRTVYAVGLALLGGAFLAASHADQSLAVPAQHRPVRRHWHRLHRQRSEFDSCSGAGSVRGCRPRWRWSIPPPAPACWSAAGVANPDRPCRLARRLSDFRNHRPWPAGAAVAAAVAAVLDRLAARRQEHRPRFRRPGLDAAECHAPPCLLGAVCDFLLHRDRHVRDLGADRCLPDRCRLSAVAGGNRLGFQRRRAVVRYAQRSPNSTALSAGGRRS